MLALPLPRRQEGVAASRRLPHREVAKLKAEIRMTKSETNSEIQIRTQFLNTEGTQELKNQNRFRHSSVVL